ncbi:PQQ-binding-like beta-propeller repeat protein [Kitasatospora sp. NBC_00039]|uniref:outer membrane protein assembly factor BamB family protein n=1 Tax=Kitasatospora sp. NBC_00039 TaxID=2903565 RepID=UPI002F90AE33
MAPRLTPNHGRQQPNQQTVRQGRRSTRRPHPAGPAAAARADVTTVSVTTERTAWDRNEPGLGPDEVAKSDFGVRFSTPLDGQVFAQPLVIGPTVVVATETNHGYGINANTGKITWHREMGPAWPSAAIGCSGPGPNVGTTSTPVYDPATGTVYLTSKVNDGPDDKHPHYYVHAVDAQSGAERSGWPATDQGRIYVGTKDHRPVALGRPSAFA